MKYLTLTGIGKREENQDVVGIEVFSSSYLFLITDGMGGHEKGKEAAVLIDSSIRKYLTMQNSINENVITKAIHNANKEIDTFNQTNKVKSGATIGGVVLEDNKAHIFWAGDVLVMQIRDSNILFKTKNHTLLNDLVDNGSVKDIDSIDKYRHVVTRSVSGMNKCNPDYMEVNCKEGDKFVLCSDGVHDVLSITQLIMECDDIDNLDMFLKQNADDNYSLIYIEV